MVVTLRIGDVLLATPLIRSLKLAWPKAEIDVLVFEHTEGVLSGNPDINRVITIARRPGLWKHLALISGLLRRYDMAVTTLMSDRPVLYAWIAAKVRFGMGDGSKKQRWKQSLLSDWVAFDNVGTHTVLMNLKLADLLGVERNHEVVVSWTPADESKAAEVLPFDVRTETFAVLHLYPKFPYKTWRQENWAELADWFMAKGIRPVFTGGNFPDELEYVGRIVSSMPQGSVNVAGKLSLSESAFLISRAKYYVGPDTALTHMAAALGTPTVSLFGPSNPVKWGPWPKNHAGGCSPYRMKGSQRVGNVVLLQGDGDCVPCMQEGCERHVSSTSDCLQNLQVARVIAALQEFPASALTGEAKRA